MTKGKKISPANTRGKKRKKAKRQSGRTSWTVSVHSIGPGPVLVTYGNGRPLAHIIGYEKEPIGFTVAQAVRISAVPEMSEALHEFAKAFQALPEAIRANKALKEAFWSTMKAIDKAEGAD